MEYLQHDRNCSYELSCGAGGSSNEQPSCLIPTPLRFYFELRSVVVTSWGS